MSRLHTAMAGSGKPYSVLTEQRHLILKYLHHGNSLDTIATKLQLEETALRLELEQLAAAHLLVLQNNSYRPDFVIVDATETQRVEQHAQQIGKALANYLLANWVDLENAYVQLSISQTHPLKHPAFFLIGDRILDIALLNALAIDSSMMPPAPTRPGPDNPDARYYFWMIEGHWDSLGKYGQNSIALPYDNWYLFTFGRYKLADAPNIARREFEAQAQAAFEYSVATEALAKSLGIPIFHPSDSGFWTASIQQHAHSLVNIYRAYETPVRSLFASLRANTYLPNHFGEFLCWYNHLAYAAAIDVLIENEVMLLPDDHFAAALWYDADSSAFHGA